MSSHCKLCIPMTRDEDKKEKRKRPKTEKGDKFVQKTGFSQRSMQEEFGVPLFYCTLATVGQLGFDVDGRTTKKIHSYISGCVPIAH